MVKYFLLAFSFTSIILFVIGLIVQVCTVLRSSVILTFRQPVWKSSSGVRRVRSVRQFVFLVWAQCFSVIMWRLSAVLVFCGSFSVSYAAGRVLQQVQGIRFVKQLSSASLCS